MPARTTQQPEEPQPAEENEVTTPADLGFGSREIEVDPIQEQPQQELQGEGMVVVRMAETIEDFTYGDPHRHFHLKQGNRYRMPANIARYLDSLGYIYH